MAINDHTMTCLYNTIRKEYPDARMACIENCFAIHADDTTLVFYGVSMEEYEIIGKGSVAQYMKKAIKATVAEYHTRYTCQLVQYEGPASVMVPKYSCCIIL